MTCFVRGSQLTVRRPRLISFDCDDRLTWVLSGWSILTWFQCGGRPRLLFTRGIVSLGIGNDLGCVWVSKMTWFNFWIEMDLDLVWWCSTANRYGVLTDIFMCWYVLEDHSVTVDWVSQEFIFYKRTKEVQAQVVLRTDWVAQYFTRRKRTREVRGSNPTGDVGHFFLKCIFLKIISTQWPAPKQDPLTKRSTS